MAPPTRLRPHLNDLLQKNLELEHVVADLRHQLTQSAAKWADERKLLAVGCDTLMASFAKFRARLDVHPSDWGDSEGEVEQNLDAGGQSEEAGEADSGMLEPEKDQGSSTVEEALRDRCHTLAAELQAKEEELEESRRKHEAVEEELRHVQQSLEARSEQLREDLASINADGDKRPSQEPMHNSASARATPSTTELEDTLKKLDLANQEINRLKQLLLQWQKYGNDWKREAQIVQVRSSELEMRALDLDAQIKAAEGRAILPEAERQEVQRLTSSLADQTAATEQQRKLCEESAKRINDLEAMVALLRAQLTPEQLASIDSAQSQPQSTPGPSNPGQSPTPQTDNKTNNINKRSDMIMLKIPFRSRKPSAENNDSQDEQPTVSSAPQAPISIRVSPAPDNNPPNFNLTDYELCIHTCNPIPCRNEAQSFLWPRRQTSLPRHALSTKKHRRCTADCPGHRLLAMPFEEALKQPRRTKCRPPSDAELALAAEEASKLVPNEPSGEQEVEAEKEGSGEQDEADEVDEGITQEETVQEKGPGEEQSPRKALLLGKRVRSRLGDSEEARRARKLRPRSSATAKSVVDTPKG